MHVQTIQTIMVNSLIEKYNQNSNIFNGLPEFNFIAPLAEKIKSKGCTCGMGSEMGFANEIFNNTVLNLNDESVTRIKDLLQMEKLCFGVQTQNGFEVKCYD